MCMSSTSSGSVLPTRAGRCDACSVPPVPVTSTGKLLARMKASSSARSSRRLYEGEYMSVDQRNGERGDALATADEAELLGGGGLDVDRRRRDAEIGGNVAGHARHVRRHPRRLGDDGGIDVDDLVALPPHLVGDVAQQLAAVDVGALE